MRKSGRGTHPWACSTDPHTRRGLDVTRDPLGTERLFSDAMRRSNKSGELGLARARLSRLRLETRGRKTGLPHIVELRYICQGDSFYVLSGQGVADWAKNALASGEGVVRLGDLLYRTEATAATEAERKSTFEAFVRKYGRRTAEDWYGESRACLRLKVVENPVKRGSPGGELEAETDFAEWSRERKDYYGEVALAFDSASEEYDFTIGRNFINTWIRRRSIAVLSRYVSEEDTVLEVGCGTGAEAVEVSGMVARILATDVSQKMVDIVIAKAAAKGLEARLTAIRAPASDLSRAKEYLGGGRFRAAYSFNGALNCEPRLDRFVEQLQGLLEPGGVFVCSVRNTLCLTELLSHVAVLQFGRAAPRRKQPIMVSVGGRDIPSTYYPPSAFIERFARHFEVVEVIALPGLLPPAYLNDYYLRLRSVTAILERLDLLLSGRFPLNRFGDQTLFVLRRKTGEGGEGAK